MAKNNYADDECCVTTPTQVSSEISAYISNVCDAENLIVRIAEALNGITRQGCEPISCQPEGTQPQRVPVAEVLFNANVRLYTVCNTMRSLLERIEL